MEKEALNFKIKERVQAGHAVLVLAKFIVLLGIASIAPFLLPQSMTGPIVNAILFIATVILGVRAAVLIALIPSIVALSSGLLPLVLAPMIPFIMLGNIVLVFSFDYLRKKNYFIGAVAASFLKFTFLFLTSSVVVNLIMKEQVAVKAAAMLSYPQLFTALAGGAIAYVVLKAVKRI